MKRETIIERLEILKNWLKHFGFPRSKPAVIAVQEAIKLLKEQETVVRCMDCKFRGNTNICPLAYIEKAEQFTALCIDEWYCGNGKRKEGR